MNQSSTADSSFQSLSTYNHIPQDTERIGSHDFCVAAIVDVGAANLGELLAAGEVREEFVQALGEMLGIAGAVEEAALGVLN